MAKKGKLIVLEGIDGSGKTTQLNLLIKKFKKENIKFKTIDFPQYTSESSYFIRQYLNGFYGDWQGVGPYQTSIFYALDRFDATPKIKKWLRDGYLIISNRYTASNLAHQGSKIKNQNKRRNFFKWIINFEHNLLGIPRPDLNIILYLKAEMAQKLIGQKGKREYLSGIKKDIHEADLRYLRQTEKVYLELSQIYPKEFKLVKCFDNNILSINEIHQKIWSIIKKFIR